MHYFIDTIGSKGLTKFDLPCEVKKLYSFPASVMRDIAEGLSERAKERNIKTEFIHCFLDNSVKGIIFPELDRCIVNILPYEEGGLINALDSGYAQALRELKRAQAHFQDALSVHDEWEKYYIDNFDFELINDECIRICNEIFGDKKGKGDGKIYDRFLGAATAFGAIDYVENLTENIKTRYFIKGRPGTGKSTFLKKIVNDARERGFCVERYHCAFDPNSLDMVIIRELDVALFDSTAPHEHFPSRDGDIILDFYELAAKRNIDREFKEELFKIAGRYKEKINMATDCIARCNNIFRQNEKSYIERIDKKNVLCLTEVLAIEMFGI